MLERLGRFSHDHRRLVLVLWAALLTLGVAMTVTGVVTDRLGGGYGSDTHESVQGYRILDRTEVAGPRIWGAIDGAGPDSPAAVEGLRLLRAELQHVDGVVRILDPVNDNAPELVARDGRAVLVSVQLESGMDEATERSALDAVAARIHGLRSYLPDDVSVLVGGNGSLLRSQINAQTHQDTTKGEGIALPITLLVMVFLFGGLLAAGVPFLGALASIAGGLLGLYGFSFLVDLDASVLSVTTVLGLGLSIDYGLLMVSRFREERHRGLDPRSAVVTTTATAGRTVAFSGLIVAMSLAGLFLFPSTLFRAMAAAGTCVVLAALASALTLTPALLGMVGHRITGKGASGRDDGFFARTARRVHRRPLEIVIVTGTALALAGAPFLGVNLVSNGPELLPRSFESRQFADLVNERFPGQDSAPVLVIARVEPARLSAWVTEFGNASLRAGGVTVASTGRAEQLRDGYSRIEVRAASSYRDADAQELVRELRADRPSFPVWVTGSPASLVDVKDEIRERAPWALGLVTLATLVLLFLMTGSVLVPIKALIMNVLSLGTTFGALAVIFQGGHGASLLGADTIGGIEISVPVIVFAFAFGLSMDYEVFLLSRIKELRDSGMPNHRAVEIGLQRSGRIITSAALLMVVVFLGFAAGELLVIKQLGVAMAIAVVVDVTVIRCLLVPATLSLFGEANWWAPAPLRRLHGRLTGRTVRPAGERAHQPAR